MSQQQLANINKCTATEVTREFTGRDLVESDKRAGKSGYDVTNYYKGRQND